MTDPKKRGGEEAPNEVEGYEQGKVVSFAGDDTAAEPDNTDPGSRPMQAGQDGLEVKK